MLPVAFVLSAALFVPIAEPEAAPKIRVDRDHAVKIALAHLKIDKVTKEPSEAFNLNVREDKLTPEGVKVLSDGRNGMVRHADIGGMPEKFEVFHVSLQHGLAGNTSVYVSKDGGRVVLVLFHPEG